MLIINIDYIVSIDYIINIDFIIIMLLTLIILLIDWLYYQSIVNWWQVSFLLLHIDLLSVLCECIALLRCLTVKSWIVGGAY